MSDYDLIIKQLAKRSERVLLLFSFLCCPTIFCPLSAWAEPSVTVYGIGTYTDQTELVVSLYADTSACNIMSYGVKLTYNTSELTLVSADRNTKIWYFGNGVTNYRYMSPDISTGNEITFIGGRIDTSNPTGGIGGTDLLLGQVIFTPKDAQVPALSLSSAYGSNYKSFSTTDHIILDDEDGGVIWGPVTVIPLDSDADGIPDYIENTTCTKPDDADTDDDGIVDGEEDANHDGYLTSGETDPCNPDTDGDGIQDGTELGYTLVDIGDDTDITIFQPDLDPNSTTDPLLQDTDRDGLPDGVEDANFNGMLDPGETDPNVGNRKAMPWLLLLLGD